MKRFTAGWIIVLMMLLPVLSCAEGIVPYASEEINAASVALSAQKKITYNVSVTSSSYTVHVNSCSLYKQTGTKVWTYVTSMSDALPSDSTGDMLVACDASDYITESGTFRVKASYTVGNSTITRTSNSRTFD